MTDVQARCANLQWDYNLDCRALSVSLNFIVIFEFQAFGETLCLTFIKVLSNKISKFRPLVTKPHLPNSNPNEGRMSGLYWICKNNLNMR